MLVQLMLHCIFIFRYTHLNRISTKILVCLINFVKSYSFRLFILKALV